MSRSRGDVQYIFQQILLKIELNENLNTLKNLLTVYFVGNVTSAVQP